MSEILITNIFKIFLHVLLQLPKQLLQYSFIILKGNSNKPDTSGLSYLMSREYSTMTTFELTATFFGLDTTKQPVDIIIYSFTEKPFSNKSP